MTFGEIKIVTYLYSKYPSSNHFTKHLDLTSPLCAGDTHLGGEDFDQRVMDHFIKLYKKKKGKDLRKDVRAVQKLRREVEKAKRALSAAHQVCHH